MKNFLITMVCCALVPIQVWGQDTTTPEQGPPPTELTQRNGFWTANNAPTSTENFQVHVVAPGDTLWAIAGQYLENPLLWPQLWETNEHIINPHWIYPEDLILIAPITQITEAAPPPPVEDDEEEPRPPVQLPNLTPDLPPPTPLGALDLPEAQSASAVKASDLYCSGFISASDVPNDLRVLTKAPGTSTDGFFAAEGDYVYLSQGASGGVQPGDIFTAVRGTRNIDSLNGDELGHHYLELAQLEAVTVQAEFSMARIAHSCDAVRMGDPVVPFNEIDFPELPSNRPFSPTMPSTGQVQGSIVMAQSVLQVIDPELGASAELAGGRTNHLSDLATGVAASGQIVYIDLGQSDGVQTGDLFLIYRPINLESRFFDADPEAERLLAGQREVIGELVVLKVEDRASTAMITFAADGVGRGDRIERR